MLARKTEINFRRRPLEQDPKFLMLNSQESWTVMVRLSCRVSEHSRRMIPPWNIISRVSAIDPITLAFAHSSPRSSATEPVSPTISRQDSEQENASRNQRARSHSALTNLPYVHINPASDTQSHAQNTPFLPIQSQTNLSGKLFRTMPTVLHTRFS